MNTNIRDITSNDQFQFFYSLEGRPAECLPGKPYRAASPSWVARSMARGTCHAVDASVVQEQLRYLGQTVILPAEGYWTLDGVRIDNPSQELGEEFGEVCEFVQTKEATSKWVPRFTAAEIDAMMAAEVAAVEAAAAKLAEEALKRQFSNPLRVVVWEDTVEVYGGFDGYKKLTTWSSKQSWGGKPLAVGLEIEAGRHAIVAAHKAAILELIEAGSIGTHQLA